LKKRESLLSKVNFSSEEKSSKHEPNRPPPITTQPTITAEEDFKKRYSRSVSVTVAKKKSLLVKKEESLTKIGTLIHKQK